VEYALAAQKGKRNIYLNFGMNVTANCDCVGRSMKPVIGDFGIFASADPVAVDKACYDLAARKGKTFRGKDQFDYAGRVGLGSAGYELVEV
jgi:hypothetical protein